MIEPLKSKDNKANNLIADTGINYVGRDEICKTVTFSNSKWFKTRRYGDNHLPSRGDL